MASLISNYRPEVKDKTIDITPTWGQVLPWMLAVLEDKDASEKAKAPLREEIKRLGAVMDAKNGSWKPEQYLFIQIQAPSGNWVDHVGGSGEAYMRKSLKQYRAKAKAEKSSDKFRLVRREFEVMA